MSEAVEAQQFRKLVWGNIKPIDNLKDPPWKFYGIVRDQVLVGVYLASERLGHWQGAFTMVVRSNELIEGTYIGFDEDDQSVVSSPYKWERRRG
jgi:hypothetical protein